MSSDIGGTVAVIDTASKEIKQVIRFKIPGLPADQIQPVGMEIMYTCLKKSSQSDFERMRQKRMRQKTIDVKIK